MIGPINIPFGENTCDIRSYQLKQLRRLLSAQSSNLFYRESLQYLERSIMPRTLDEFTAKIPLTQKHQLVKDQLMHPPFGTNRSCGLDQYKRFHQTSGTTATPLRWLDTEHSWQIILNRWQQIFQAAGVLPPDRICFCFSFGPFLGFWSAFEAATQMGCFAIPTGGMTSHARIKLILDTQATVLCCTPSYALRLAQVARKNNLSIEQSSIQRIFVAGEPGGSIPATRSLIEEAWNARVYDHHGMTETGPISYPCPLHKDILHVFEDSFLIEVINPLTQLAVNNGEPGELVITTLDRYASPLLRYRTGDLVQASYDKCSCGSPHLTLIGGILGRVDDMIIVRGVNVYPSLIEELVRKSVGVAEYRIVVYERLAMVEVCLQIELESATNASRVRDDLHKSIYASLNLRFQIEFLPPGTLHHHGMKSQRWIHVKAQ